MARIVGRIKLGGNGKRGGNHSGHGPKKVSKTLLWMYGLFTIWLLSLLLGGEFVERNPSGRLRSNRKSGNSKSTLFEYEQTDDSGIYGRSEEIFTLPSKRIQLVSGTSYIKDDDHSDDDHDDDALDYAHANAFNLPSKRIPLAPVIGFKDGLFDGNDGDSIRTGTFTPTEYVAISEEDDESSFTQTSGVDDDPQSTQNQEVAAHFTTNKNSGNNYDEDNNVNKHENDDPPKFLFIHIGKSGGSTIYKNIRNLCLRKNVVTNIAKIKNDNPIGIVPCMKQLKKQADPVYFNPTTEMKISTENMVIGSLHMNQKSWWWNADDDQEANNPKNQADKINWILSFGNENAWNQTALQNPSFYEGNDHGLADSTAFLVPLRDPIDRVVSAFNYQHPENTRTKLNCKGLSKRPNGWRATRYWIHHSFYCECFPTANDLADVFLDPGGNETNMRFVPSLESDHKMVSCLKIAEIVLRGNSSYEKRQSTNRQELDDDYSIDRKLLDFQRGAHERVPSIGHLTMNYGFYYRRTVAKYPNKEIVAIRTKHLYEDLQTLEHELGGGARIKGSSTGHHAETYGSESFAVSAKVTDPKRLQALCCAIPTEAAIYIELIQRASNLSHAQKKESLEAFSERCDLNLCGETKKK